MLGRLENAFCFLLVFGRFWLEQEKETNVLPAPEIKKYMFAKLLGLMSTDMAIDLGTANTLVYVKGRGIAERP